MEPLNLEDCDKIVKKYLPSDDVKTLDFTLRPLPKQNFQLEVTFLHNQEEKKLKFFAKSSLNVPKISDIINTFKEVLPKFDADFTPNLYYTKQDLLVFEGMKTQNFRSKLGFLDVNHLVVALKVLAKLHAASFAFEKEKSKISSNFKLDEEYSLLHLNFVLKNPEVKDLISTIFASEEEVNKVIEDLEDRFFSSKFRRTLSHGNLISKNILFKYEKETPTDCKLINLKSNFYAPPIYDVLQLIFFNTEENLRQNHLQDLILTYRNYLKEEMEGYDLNIEEMLPIEGFLLSSHHFLPLIKLETCLVSEEQDKEESSNKSKEELREILTWPLLSREDCHTIITNKIGTTKYELLSFKVTSLNDVSGFLGEYHKLQIRIRHLSEEKTINCFIKCPPKTGIPRELAQDVGSFSREIFMYQTLAPKMQELGIDIINECLPPCYFQRHEDLMVFEDMSLLNYRNLDALKPLDFTYLKMLIKKLAKFHACSLILEEKMSEKSSKPYQLIEDCKEYFKEPLFFVDENHLGSKIFMTGIKSVLAAVDVLSEIKTEENQRNFETFWPKFKDLFYTVIKTSDRFRNVLSHGDLWTSNMLVKFEDEEPIDCVLIDFQIVRYCPPAYDLLSVLHLTTDRSTRLKYEDELIEEYYDELGKVLSCYGLDVKKSYPHDDFIGCIEHMKPQMVMQAAIDCVLTMCTPEEISSFLTNEEVCKFVYFEDRTEFLTEMCKKSSLYKTRLTECILDVYDYCNSMCEK